MTALTKAFIVVAFLFAWGVVLLHARSVSANLDAWAAQQPEGSLGTFPLPVELGTHSGFSNRESESYILAAGLLSSADHEAIEGFASVQRVSLSVPADSIPADILRQLRGRDVEIVIRAKSPRVLQEIRK